MLLSSKQTTTKKPKLDSAYIHDYDRTLAKLHDRIKTTMSQSDRQILLDYDVNTVNQVI